MADTSYTPHPTGMPSFWRETVGSLDTHRSTPELPATTDIVIIGSGFSGGSLVTHLLKNPETTSRAILVLEARELCSGATGRNGGHLKPDAYNLIARYADKFGVEAAGQVAEFEVENLKAIAEYIRRENVDCDFFVTRAVDVQLDERHNERLRGAHKGLVENGVAAAREVFYMEGADAEIFSGINGAKGAFSYTAAHLCPYKLIHHMFTSALHHANINLQTTTPVIRISNRADPAGLWTVETQQGSVKARTVIMATNAYTGGLLPEYAERIIPYRGICSRVAMGKGERGPLLNNSYAVRFDERDFDYLIPRKDGSVVVGGGRAAYIHDTKSWYGNTDDGGVIPGVEKYFDRYMQKHFHGWEATSASTSSIWTGIMGYSADRSPHIGPVPGRPGVFIMAGFTGHGMPQIFLGAKGLVEMVTGKTYEESGLPGLFETTRERVESTENWLLDFANQESAGRTESGAGMHKTWLAAARRKEEKEGGF